MIKKIFFLIEIFILSTTVNSFAMPKDKAFNLITDRGNFVVKFTLVDAKVTIGSNKANLEIYDRDKNPIKSAKIEILLWMNEHGHYSSATPVAKEIRPGYYEISNLNFEMKGSWEIIINIKKDKIKDKASFEIMVE